MRVLYVAGLGRSGSTLVSRILSRIDGFAWAGELKLLWESTLPRNPLCGCGVPFRSCPFWRDVLQDAFGGIDTVDPEGPLAFKHRYLRGRHSLPLLDARVRPRLEQSAEAREHLLRLSRLYRAIGERLGAQVVIDSSASPAYAEALAAAPELELLLLHVVRDPRGAAHSWQTPKRWEPDRPGEPARWRLCYSPAETSVFWDVWNSGTERLARRSGLPYFRVRYEDFAAAPRRAIAEIAAFAGAPGARLPFVDDATVMLDTDHSSDGNPIRFTAGPVRVELDEAWRSSLSMRDRLTVTALTLPLLRRYGYPVRST